MERSPRFTEMTGDLLPIREVAVDPTKATGEAKNQFSLSRSRGVCVVERVTQLPRDLSWFRMYLGTTSTSVAFRRAGLVGFIAKKNNLSSVLGEGDRICGRWIYTVPRIEER